jgi:hypothetical protein
MTRPLSLTPWLLLAPLVAWAAPSADDAATNGFRRASACVAVMKRDVVGLTEHYHAGNPGVRPDIQRLTELGFVFIGTAYKSGLRKPQADQLLEEAEQAQKHEPADVLKLLSTDCQAEGAKLMRDTNFVERALVSNRAKARVETLLAADKPH